jgi:cell wall-associated NlpC family hydrolase
VTGTLAHQSQGVDCTNLTAAAYADALGIQMSGDTTTQSEIATGNTVLKGQTAPGKNYITLPTNADGSASGVDNWILKKGSGAVF